MLERRPHRYIGYVRPARIFRTHPFETKIGGVPIGLPQILWPICGQCGRPMRFLLQLNLNSPASLAFRSKLAYLFVCDGYENADEGGKRCQTYYSETGASVVVLASPRWPLAADAPAGVEAWPERSFIMYEYDVLTQRGKGLPDPQQALWEALEAAQARGPDANGMYQVVKPEAAGRHPLLLGGDPDWLQDDETPTCPKCKGETRLLAQIHSHVDEDYDLPFGGTGDGYLFICANECCAEGTSFLWQCT